MATFKQPGMDNRSQASQNKMAPHGQSSKRNTGHADLGWNKNSGAAASKGSPKMANAGAQDTSTG